MTRVISLLGGDLRNIYRDPMMILMVVLPFIIAVTMRLFVPWITELAEGTVDIAPYHRLILSVLPIMTPLVVGWLVGFLLLDDRDEAVLLVISVTPLGKRGFLFYRLAAPIILALPMTYAAVAVASLAPVDALRLLPVALMASLEAPIAALTLAAFASNKVEGLALAKGLSMASLAPLGVELLSSTWQIPLWILPPYWAARAFLADGSGLTYWLPVGVGIAVHLAWLFFLLRRFDRKIG